jgi:hypothetical protein
MQTEQTRRLMQLIDQNPEDLDAITFLVELLCTERGLVSGDDLPHLEQGLTPGQRLGILRTAEERPELAAAYENQVGPLARLDLGGNVGEETRL